MNIDSERRISGQTNSKVLARTKGANEQYSMAFNLDAYSRNLGKHMPVRLWQYTEHGVAWRPLGVRMLRLVQYETRTVFSRPHYHKRVNGNVAN